MVWKPIPGFPHYEASDGGLIRSKPHTVLVVQRTRTYEARRKGKVLSPIEQGNGYLYVTLPSDGPHRQVPVGIHRLVCLAFHGEPPPGRNMALHKNDISTDNRSSNLYWGHNFENRADAARNGRVPKGMAHHATTLTQAQVDEIRRRYKPKCRKNGAKPLGAEFDVHHTTIQNIAAYRTWA